MTIAFNELLDVLNGNTAENESLLLKAFTVEVSPKPYSVDEVAAVAYRLQKYYRHTNTEAASYYVAGTLFVAWTDGTTSCWFNARDMLRGIGYDTANVKATLDKYLSKAGNRYLAWSEISKYILLHRARNPSDSGVQAIGCEEANDIKVTTLFLTEQGVIELHQQAPKCKMFRNSIANFLFWFRSMASPNHGFESAEQCSAKRQQQALTDADRAAYDSKINELRDAVARAQLERDQAVESSRAEIQQTRQEQETAIARLREQHQQLVASIRKQHQAQLENLQSDQRLEIDTLRSNHANVVESYRVETARLQSSVNNLQNEYTNLQTEYTKLSAKHHQQQVQSQELQSRIARLTTDCNKLQRERERIYQEVTRYNFLYFNPDLVPVSEQNVCVLVYIGKLRDYPEDRPRHGFWCIRGQRQHAKRVLEELYTDPASRDESAPPAKRQCRRPNRGTVHTALAKLGKNLRRCSKHLYHPDRKTALDKLYQLDNDYEFNNPRHARIIMRCINPTLMVRMARFFDIAKRRRAAARAARNNSDAYNNDDDYDEEEERRNLGPEFPFRQYAGYANANLYVATDEHARSPLYALKMFEAFASYYGSPQAFAFGRSVEIDNDDVDLVFDDDEDDDCFDDSAYEEQEDEEQDDYVNEN